ncbi:LLM class F420-dependent oxidoreductase [Anaerolineales bacterium]
MTQAQIGLMIEGQNGLNWPRWKAILQTAEDCNYQCVFRSDHFVNATGEDLDSLELWTSLTYAASYTSRLEFGPLVTPVTFRHPMLNIRYAAAIDDLSAGRLIYGLGAGWQDREHRRFGIPFHDFPTRYEMLEEALEVTRTIFHSPEPVTFSGEYLQVENAVLLPRPSRAGGPPILIGGSGPKRTLPLVAKYADEWNAVFIAYNIYKERNELLKQMLEEQGRIDSDVKRSLMTQVIYEKDDASLNTRLEKQGRSAHELIEQGLIVGTGAQVVDQIGRWVEAGVQRFMLQWLDLDNLQGLEDLAADVLPHFHHE